MVMKTTKSSPKPRLTVEPARAPFSSYVSGSGLVEAVSENVKVASQVAGVVTKVFVKAGDQVEKGQRLWQLDDTSERALLARHEAALQSAMATLDKLRRGNRPEEIVKQEAEVDQVAAQLRDSEEQLTLREAASTDDARAVSVDDLNQARNAVRQRQASLAYQKAQFVELKEGTWMPEIKVQEAEVSAAWAQVAQTRADLEKYAVRSPLNGTILQIKIHAGEYSPASQTDDALMMVGSRGSLAVRVDIDEQDAWRIQKSRSAVAYVRGRSDIKISLTFARTEPYVIPKKSLTGDSTERVDTRVLELIYDFQQPSEIQVYVGQQMDVYVEAPLLPDPEESKSGKSVKVVRK